MDYQLKEQIISEVTAFTTHSRARLEALYLSILDVIHNGIEGDYVECGVDRGGSSMLVSHIFKNLGSDKKIWMYDTYDGMQESDITEHDINIYKQTASARNETFKARGGKWCYCPLHDVIENMQRVNENIENINFIAGNVLETIPEHVPDKISVLHLDTDFYTSTKHELENLFPLLDEKGFCIVDDYGWWSGSKKAVDEFIKDKPLKVVDIDGIGVFLQREE